MLVRLLALFLLSSLAACGKGGGESDSDAAPRPDSIGIDAGTGDTDGAPPDADPPDAAPVIPPSSAQEVTAGAARVRGGQLVLDVQLGHGAGQQPVSGGGLVVRGASAVEP